jgi:hypothetical protein
LTHTVSGSNFGSVQGNALVFDRILNDYVPAGVISWSDTEIVLDSDWDIRDGDTAVKIVTEQGAESFAYCIPYTAAFAGFCRITYRSGIDHAIRQGELNSSQFTSLVIINTQTGTATLNGEVVNIKGQTIGFEFGSLFNLTSISNYFLYGCSAFNSLTTETASSPTDNNSLSQSQSINNPMYAIGVMVSGSQRTAWLAALPNRTATPWRRLIDGGG